MFLGHFAAGLAAQKVSPRTPLWLLLIAGQLVDLLWPAFLLLGLEKVEISPGITTVTPLDFIFYPYTHSLLGGIGWGFVFGGLLFSFRKNDREAWVIAALVVSHWFLDLFSHRPDLQLFPGMESKYGLGLWSSLPATLLVEIGLLAAGVIIYLRTTRPLDSKGTIGFWSLIGILVAVYLASLFGPPPPSVNALAFSAFGIWLFIALAWWTGRHRANREQGRSKEIVE